MKQPLPPPRPAWVPLRGASGRLYGYYDPQSHVIEFKRGGMVPERVELTRLAKPS